MDIITGALLIIGVLSFLVVFICILLFPIAINEQKIREGHSWRDLHGIPEMYKKEWYSEKRLWIRSGVILGKIGSIATLLIAYILHQTGII